jgi:hypothetical protein
MLMTPSRLDLTVFHNFSAIFFIWNLEFFINSWLLNINSVKCLEQWCLTLLEPRHTLRASHDQNYAQYAVHDILKNILAAHYILLCRGTRVEHHWFRLRKFWSWGIARRWTFVLGSCQVTLEPSSDNASQKLNDKNSPFLSSPQIFIQQLNSLPVEFSK